jgi:murein L,D-transpeptidase YcbB/YkuD
MKKLLISLIVITFGLSVVLVSCKKGEPSDRSLSEIESEISFDSTLVRTFFGKHPKLKEFRPQVEKLYRKHSHHYLWFDKKGLNEVADLLYSKIANIDDEGVPTSVPYKAELEEAIDRSEDASKPNPETELLISALYFFYADKVFHGLDAKQSQELGWYLPRKKMSYVSYLDSLLIKPSLMNKDEKEVMGQYYRLKEALVKYRDIEKKGGWQPIAFSPKMKSLKPGDSSPVIAQIRTRLFVTGDIKNDNKSATYDGELANAVVKYNQRTGSSEDNIITTKVIEEMNIPAIRRIKTIMVNMERCRWISANILKAQEYILINIPSYKLTYYKEGKPALVSDVVVGKFGHRTVVFSGMMKYIVFSPYWNVPKSIVEKEINPGIEKNSNYLEEHDMERNGDEIRQRPGPKNSLGLVKFLFPNSNNIYLHDTPAKELFNKDDRAFSHGCIRVQKTKELANLILENDKSWSPEKIDAALHAGTEKWVTLKNKIPVYIGYFTAWVDGDGVVHFYEDVYNRDDRLASMIYRN